MTSRIVISILALFLTSCTDLGTLDYDKHDTIRITGYFETWEQRNSPYPLFIVTSGEIELPDTITVRSDTQLQSHYPQPRVRTGLVLFTNYDVKMVVRKDIELEYVNIPVETYTLLDLEGAYYAHTDKGRFAYSLMLQDRQFAPAISIGDTFRATRTDSTFTSLDR